MGEHLGRDYYNFGAMYDFVVRWRTAARIRWPDDDSDQPPPLAKAIIDWLPRVFVEPYACVEISRHYQGRLRAPIGETNMLRAKTANRSKPLSYMMR